MTNITFKNGLPLFLAEDGAPGLVAVSQNCCCPPPPPPGCWCPDFCLYKIKILSPVQFGPGPPAACGGSSSGNEFAISLYPPCEDEEECCGPVTEPVPGLVGPTVDRVYAFAGSGYASVRYVSKLGARAEAQISFRCENVGEPGVTYADISLGIIVPADEGLVARTPRRVIDKFATVALDATCSLRTGVTCNPVDPNAEVRFAFLDVPLEFTVTAASAGLVGWDESRTVDVPIGDQTRVTPCFDHLVDNFEATFRITARENCLPPEPLCPCNCSGSGFDFCDFSEQIDLSYASGCGAPYDTVNQFDVPCFNLTFADFEDLLYYFGTAAQGYPFSKQWMKDEAVATYANETCSFAIHACQKVRVSSSRCMRGDECICLNGSVTVSNNWYVQFFDCALEQWVDITSDILTESREVFFSYGQVLGPANNCFDCEFDNGNPPEPPEDPGPCDYDITAGECENITGNFP